MFNVRMKVKDFIGLVRIRSICAGFKGGLMFSIQNTYVCVCVAILATYVLCMLVIEASVQRMDSYFLVFCNYDYCSSLDKDLRRL